MARSENANDGIPVISDEEIMRMIRQEIAINKVGAQVENFAEIVGQVSERVFGHNLAERGTIHIWKLLKGQLRDRTGRVPR